jgi:nicotinamide phosphoribosyltransferase
MKPTFSLHQCDFYKVGHVFQYPDHTTLVYTNFTPRKSRIEGVEEMVFFGANYLIKEYFIRQFNETFFRIDKEEAIRKYARRMRTSLFSDLQSYKHLEDLHDLQYLPIRVKAVPEGTLVGMRVPCLTITNTRPEFYWLPNFLETIISTTLWQPCTSATIARQYRRLLVKAARETVTKTGDISFVNWQGHDFSYRGMGSNETACTSGAGHLTSFWGTDTIPAIDFLEEYYNIDAEKEIIGGSVPATEHSVMCMGGKGDEIETFRRLITKVYPSGIVSIVSDTWDFWKVINEYAPALKTEILNRSGAPFNKVVFRPDSGVPYHIIAGYRDSEVKKIDAGKYVVVLGPNMGKVISEVEKMGTIEVLWNHFGGTTTEQGYKLLDSHVGCIYGDSITLSICREILERLEEKGFASFNMVFGIGSFTYQYNTRDTFGIAMKATYGEVLVPDPDANEADEQQFIKECREIYKDPVTDDGTKKSAKGLIQVNEAIRYTPDSYGKLHKNGYVLTMRDQVSWKEEEGGILETIFEDGKLIRDTKFSEVRARLGFN